MNGESADKEQGFPSGLSAAHLESRGRATRFLRTRASPFSIILLGAVLAAAMLGVFGGRPYPQRTAKSSEAALTVTAPQVLRDGMFFEMRFDVLAKEPIAEPVLAIEPSLWRDVTINTFIPAPTDEEYKDGAFRFTFPALDTGDRMTIKVDGQINPSLVASTEGEIAIFDGDSQLASMPYSLKVYP